MADLGPAAPSRFAVMQHLRVLEAARVVVTWRHGRTRANLLNPVPIQQLYEQWIRQFRGLKPPPLLRFLDRAQHRRELRRIHLRRSRTFPE